MTTEELAALIAGYSTTVQNDPLQEKINKLNQRAAAKVDRLSTSKAAIENYADTDYTGVQRKHGRTVKTTGVHDFTNQQEEFGRLVNEERVFTGKFLNEGTSLNLDPTSNYKIKDGEYVKFDGPTRNAYIRNMGIDPVTGEQIQKLGLARNDLTDEAIAQGITPERARYMNKLGINVYKGSGGDYDGTPGTRGEAMGEALFDAAFDEDAITEFELKRYMDKSTIGARAMGLGKNADHASFGGGGSEYTIDKLDPLFNIDAPRFEGELPEGTQTPTVPRGFDKTGAPEPSLDDRRKALNERLNKGQTEKSYFAQLQSLPQAFAAGAGKSAYDVLDTYTEIGGDVTGRAVGLASDEAGKAIDKWADLGTEEEKIKRTNAVFGYDNSFTANNMEKVGNYWDEAVKDVEFLSPSTWTNIKGGKLVDAAKTAFSDIETAAYSLGYMAPALAGAFGKAGAKLVGGVVKKHSDEAAANLKAVAQGKMTKDAAKEANKKSLNAMSKADRTKLFLVNNADALQYGAMMNNNQMDEYIEGNGGEDATLLRNILGTAANAVGMKLDVGVMNAILKPSKGTAEVIGEFIKGAGAAKSRVMLGTIAELSTRAAIAGLHEMPQEWGQTFIESFNSVYGTKDKDGTEVGVGEAISSATREAAIGSLAGLAGGVHTSLGIHGTKEIAKAVPAMVGASTKAVKKGVELATETPEQKTTRQNREYSTPLKNEALFAALSGNAADVADRAEKVHGKLSAELDESAPKRQTYGKILKDALGVATKAGDEAAINNVYKTIAALDKDETVEFNAKDMVNESAYAKTQELIKLINQNTDTTDSKLQELKGEVSEEINKNTAVKAKNAEILALKESLTTMKNKFKHVMGTDELDQILEPLTKLENTAKDYLAGTKTLDDVNKEFAELGFMDTEGKADPNRPGLAAYEKELTDKLLNAKTNKNLLKVKAGASGVKLTGLTKFAKSRLSKLKAKGTKGSYQTSVMMGKVKAENEKMLKTITNVLKVAKGLKNVDEATRKSYEEELTTAANAAIESSKELDRRKSILDTAVKPDGVAGTLAFQVDTDGESIQAVTYKDGKPVKVKIADVIDDKVVPTEKYAETKVEVVEPAVEVKEPVKTRVEPTKVEVTKEQEVDLSNLSKADRTFVKNYRSGKAKLTIARTEKYNKLMELAKKPKVKKESRGRKVKAAAEVRFGESESDAADRVKAMFKSEDKVKKYAETLSKDDLIELERIAEESRLAEEKLAEEEFQKFSDDVDEIAKLVEDSEGPLATVRANIAKVDAGLSQLIDSVPDMEVKQQVKEHYAKKLGELQADKTRLGKMIDRLESTLAKRLDRKYDKESSNVVTALISQIDKLAKSMLTQLVRLEKMLKKASKEYRTVAAELNAIIAEIDAIEAEFASKTIKTTIGTVTKIDEKLYGVPVVEVDGKRVAAERQLTTKGKLEAPATAINRALDKLAEEKMDALRVELKEMEKGKTSLGAKLLGRLLINFPMSSPIHRIVKRAEDSVFGQLTGNTFAKADRLLEVLPKGFKDFFITDAESKQSLLDNFATMAEYIKSTKIGDIVIGKNRIAKHIDQNGLVMMNVEKDGNTYNFPVDVIELLGTVVDGKLQLDEQTQNILKFYSAKMLSDTQKMVGLILSLDESEIGQVLGIYDATEQLKVKQDAMSGYINSASVRKDIEGEVYQALGLKFNETAPEFTVESFKSALGVLVQAIAIENGSMELKKGEAGGKNQNLIKTNWSVLSVERDALTKAVTKLQYLNENRNRPLPGLKQPADDNNRKVMNTENFMDKKSTEFLNKQEKTAYTISPRLARWLAMEDAEALKAMGYVDVKNGGLHVSEIGAQMTRNDKLVREWEILKTFAKATGDKKFYLKWGQTVSGRYTILNDLNYQESKLHREFVVAEGSIELVDVNDKDARQMLEASILQGLDMDPDKLSPETASEKFNSTFKVTAKGIEVLVEGPVKKAYEALRKGKVDTEAMAEVFDASEGHHGISSIELLVAWDKAVKDGTKLETHANLEIDAITSGMILTLLQIGSNTALQMAEKGGIYTAERLPQLKEYVEKWLPGVTFTPGALIEAGKKHAAEIEGKLKEAQKKNDKAEMSKLRKQLEDDAVFKDLYSTIGVAMIGEVQAYKEKLEGLKKPNTAQLKQLAMLEQIGELNLKNIRSIAKSPVMVYIYGATVSSIKKKLTYSLGIDTLVKALKTASKLLQEGKDASKELEFINALIPENKRKFVNEFGAKIPKPKELEEQLLALDISGIVDDIGSVINATFGKAIETAFESKLGFVNKNRDAAKSVEMLVFQAYQIRLADAITKHLDMKYGQGRHKSESYKLSKDDLQNINQKLTDEGYGHNIVWYEDGETINQTLNKTDTKGGIHSSKVTVGKTSVGGQIKQFKPVVNTGAAPTISVHAIDGRLMLDVLNRDIEGKYTGGNIYDAVVLSLNKAMLTDTADSYNTNMIETGFNRSVIADQLEMLEDMFYTKDEAGNREFDEEMFNRVLNSIGLRPEGKLRADYTKEANRIGLGIGKMLESLERAEKINGERLTNSGKEFHSGHLYQMGSGVVKVNAAETRAKQFPVIDTIKRLLQEKVIADREITHGEFAKAGIKLHKDADYVANLDDVMKGANQIKSNANIAQINTSEDKRTVTAKLWGSLGSNDTVQILASKSTREWLESDKGTADYWAKTVLAEVLKSPAKIVAKGFDEKLEKSGRVLVDGVWVKKVDEGKVDTQEEVGKMKKEFVNMLRAELGKLPQIPAIAKILDKIKDC